jgi:hypothetical protein
MDEKKYLNFKLFLVLAIIVILAIVLHLFLGLGLFASGSNDLIGYLVGSGSFLIFLLIYVILKKINYH